MSQTVVPSELCIVDSSDDSPQRHEVERLCAQSEVSLDYYHPAPRGLTIQRNIGIDRTSGDPVFFIDDDVVLAPNCHERILDEYEKWGTGVGGVRASPLRPAMPPKAAILWRKLFGIGGWWPEASGRMRSGFFVEGISQSCCVRKLQYFNGWFMSYRREVFAHERFDENLSGYAYKEDVDFSYRVHRRGYTLIQVPDALVDHLKTASGRLAPFQLQRMNIANQFYLHRKNMPQTPRAKAALWWALVGLFVLNIGKAVQQRDHGYITGLLAGAWEQLRGKGLIGSAAGESSG